MADLKTMSDTELIKLAQAGNESALEAILMRYKPLVHKKSQPYYLAGGDDDDIVQEGLIGLYKAVMDFDESKFPLFKVFAGVCIERRIISAVKKASRKKHAPLNTYVSLNNSADVDYSGVNLENMVDSGRGENPETILIDREDANGLEWILNESLSPLERKVLLNIINGHSYKEIAELLNKDVKAVDNAMQRIKKKLETQI